LAFGAWSVNDRNQPTVRALERRIAVRSSRMRVALGRVVETAVALDRFPQRLRPRMRVSRSHRIGMIQLLARAAVIEQMDGQQCSGRA
jgi:hypothetical protein